MSAGRSGLLLAALIAVAAAVGYRASVFQEPAPKPMGWIATICRAEPGAAMLLLCRARLRRRACGGFEQH